MAGNSKQEERALERIAADVLDRLGEEFEELEYDRHGPIGNAEWNRRWMQVQSEVDAQLNAIPTGEEARSR